MAAPALELEIKADLSVLKAQLAEAQVMLRQLGEGAGGGPGGAGGGFGRGAKEAENFYQQLRGVKGEMVQHQRVFGMFGRQLEMVGLASKEMGAAMVGAVAGLASGMYVMAGIEMLKLVIEAFRDAGKEAEEAKKKWREAGEELEKIRDDAERAERKAGLIKRGFGQELASVLTGTDAMKIAQIQTDASIRLAENTRMLENAIGQLSVTQARRWEQTRSKEDLAELLKFYPHLKTWVDAIRESEERLAEAELTLSKVRGGAKAGDAMQRDRELAAERLRLAQEGATEREKIEYEYQQTILKFPELQVEAAASRNRKLLALDIEYSQQSAKVLADYYANVAKAQQSIVEEAQKRKEKETGWDVERAEMGGDPFKAAWKRADLRTMQGEPPDIVNAKYLKEVGEAWNAIGGQMGGAISTLGNAIGGQAGKFADALGKMIQQAVQLAVALAATSGPWGWINAAVAAASLLATIISIPKFEQGTPYVPFTGIAMLHQGERVMTASENAAYSGGQQGGGGGGAPVIVYAIDGPSMRQALRKNRGELARAYRELGDDRRRG